MCKSKNKVFKTKNDANKYKHASKSSYEILKFEALKYPKDLFKKWYWY